MQIMKTDLKQINELHKSDLYLYFYEDFIDEKRTAKECEFIIEKCKLRGGDKILDLACGHGRHSIYFASKRFNVTGIDLNESFIEIAQKESRKWGLFATFINDNILNVNFEDEFDCMLILFNSFGFLDSNDGFELMKKMRSALKAEGRLFIDIKNRDNISKELSPFYVTEKGEDLMIDRLSFDPKSGVSTNKRIYIKDGVRHDAPFSMQLYNYSELSRIAHNSGFKITSSFGNWDGGKFDIGSKRIIAILEKR